MKKPTFIALAAIVTFIAVSPSDAFAQKKKKSESAPVVETTSSSSSSSSNVDMGVGFTSYAGGALSAWFQLSEKSSIQGLLAIPSTSPFSFNLGGIFRQTVAGGRKAGLHLGGGFVLGTAAGIPTMANPTGGTIFMITVSPTVGFHFNLTDDVAVSFDGGPQLEIVDGAADFGIKAYDGNLLGLSVHYFL